MKILYTEDQPEIRELALIAMQDIGAFNVHACTSGEEALAAATSYQPDLIILDVLMPGLTGPETLIKLRDLPYTKTTPVIFMTGKACVQNLNDPNILGYIAKPFHPETLHEEIYALWHKSKH